MAGLGGKVAGERRLDGRRSVEVVASTRRDVMLPESCVEEQWKALESAYRTTSHEHSPVL